MNTIKVKVSFKNSTCTVTGISLVAGDYNSTEIKLSMDDSAGRNVFEMIDPQGNLVYLYDINSDIIPLYVYVDTIVKHEEIDYVLYKDSNDNDFYYNKDSNKLYDLNWTEVSDFDLDDYTKVQHKASLFNEKGSYKFEISKYNGDSKLTSATGSLKVRKEQIKIGDDIVTPYLPVFDELINRIQEQIEMCENLNIEAEKIDDITYITIIHKDGTRTQFEIKDGDQGPQGEKGDTSTITIGEVITGEPDTPASVENVGTETDAIFNFVIPKGETGEGSGAVIIYSSDSDETIMEKLKTIVVHDDVIVLKPAYYVDARGSYKQVFPLLAASGDYFTFARQVEGVLEGYVFETYGNVLRKNHLTFQFLGLSESFDPTENTEGQYRGQTYVNTTTGEIFYLKDWSNGNPKKYYWEKFTGGADLDKSNTFTQPQTIISDSYDGVRLEDEEDDQFYANVGKSGIQYKGGSGKQQVNIPYEDIVLKEDITHGIPTLVGTSENHINLNTLEAGLYYISGNYDIGQYTGSINPRKRLMILTDYVFSFETGNRRAYFFGNTYEYDGYTDIQTYMIEKRGNTYYTGGSWNGYLVNSTMIGDLSNLKTSTKKTLVAAINEVNDKTPVIIYASEESEETVVQKLLSCIDKENNGILVKPCTIVGGEQEIYELKRTHYSSTFGATFDLEREEIKNNKLLIYNIKITIDVNNNMTFDESGYSVDVEQIIWD